MSDPTNLRIPGPTPVPPEVIEAMSEPMIPHRGEEFSAMFSELLEQLKRIHNTKDDVFVIAGTGSAGWEISIVNTVGPGDKVIAAVNGGFGERFVQVAEHFGVNVTRLDAEWGQPIDANELEDLLKRHPDAKMVQVVHNETSTGVLNPMADLGQVVRDHGALFVVDSVSGAAGTPVDMDGWPADIVFTGSQKAFMCPPGLSIFGISDRVWSYTDSAPMARFTLDLKRIRDAARSGSTPSTAPIALIRGLKAACDLIEAEGMDALYRRHVELRDMTRKALREIGLQLLADDAYASPTVTVGLLPEGVTSDDVRRLMYERHGIYVAAGIGPFNERAIRIGHMGWTNTPELERTFQALDDVMERVPVGSVSAG
ncbi:MAG: pyridoxal-phosphate-dependent aminotransferase family protein [Chloroflexota bacterium]